MKSLLTLVAIGGLGYGGFASVVEYVTPVMEGAIAWQENTVKVAEAVGSSAAPEARVEWEANKKTALERLAAFQLFGKEMSDEEIRERSAHLFD